MKFSANLDIDSMLNEYLGKLKDLDKTGNENESRSELSPKSEINEAINGQKHDGKNNLQENSNDNEREKQNPFSDYLINLNKSLRSYPFLPHYYMPNKQLDPNYFFVYSPGGLSILRVPQSELGWGVLGVAYIGTNIIKIADHLHGQDFEEVKKHEILHMLYPHLTEWEIRAKTRMELPFYTRFN